MTKKDKESTSPYIIIWTSEGPIVKRIDEPIVWTPKGPR